jgi:hypothetical protein
MPLVSSELYAILLEAGMDMNKARQVAKALADYEMRLSQLERDISQIKRGIGLLIVMILVLAGGMALR